ncbi:hypothetical protein [Streptomyces venezuelae]|uniref:hypothetical protein n=1 Tax=Streptomyces venezuelae TaxID=54571 RepID=UPI001CC22696|nr:hypothetical protein [Streptomyces venezuelae]
MIVIQPVLEVYAPDAFALWPLTQGEPFGYLPLSGELTAAELGTAMMRIAQCNDIDPDPHAGDDRPPRPSDPLGSFLHGLLTFDTPFAAGGLRVTDSTTGNTLLPGCCNGLEDWREWYTVVDGSGPAFLGHDPTPAVELVGETVRLVIDTEQSDGPVIEVPAKELRRLLGGVERDLADFLALAVRWAGTHLPDHTAPVTAALARVLDLPAPPALTLGSVLIRATHHRTNGTQAPH